MKTLHDWALAKCWETLGIPLDQASGIVEAAEKKLMVATLTFFGGIKIERAKSVAKHLMWMAVLEEVAPLYGFDVREFCEAYEHE